MRRKCSETDHRVDLPSDRRQPPDHRLITAEIGLTHAVDLPETVVENVTTGLAHKAQSRSSRGRSRECYDRSHSYSRPASESSPRRYDRSCLRSGSAKEHSPSKSRDWADRMEEFPDETPDFNDGITFPHDDETTTNDMFILELLPYLKYRMPF